MAILKRNELFITIQDEIINIAADVDTYGGTSS
jgi:hypothetical protein